jgi:hypothetical protein
MAFPPEVYIIGAQRAGTTFLSYLLSQHPKVCLSNPKEAAFFTKNWDKGLEWYKKRFHGTPDQIFVDATPSYSAAPLTSDHNEHRGQSKFQGVPERIHSISPGARFIYLLRDPVERTYSSYLHSVKGGYERRPFRHAITEDPLYLRTSDYQGQLQQYLRYFPRAAFLILIFEELVDDPVVTARKCFEFMGIDVDVPLTTDKGTNKSYQYRVAGQLFNLLFYRWGGLDRLIKSLQPIVPLMIQRQVRDWIVKGPPKLTEDDRTFLIEYFAEKIQNLETLLDRPLDKWQTHR